ncbi:pRiA4b ORF-3-like protein [Natranaerovirga hydrolytica]|uniref:PRiA4b ORF-3-like protein n=1 Tax=Natranaerovirga hydrolytica TaxID=680378 RepID=A0A4R1MKQ8_9FIRM|nr:plasmid pRiA4b ORF-3 family protein [Natranaerovirga hydrolytica]TCK93147.1 pRiA4b ORF-3-like protein [Natranaerovirga hydrolytica]
MKSYIIKIELKNSDPLIWRRVIMPAGATFNMLHDVIQTVTNFQSGYPVGDYHLYEFDLKDIRVTNDDEAYQEHLHFMKNENIYKERLKKMSPEHAKFEKTHQERLEIVVRKPKGIKIDDYLEKYKDIIYNYDFGDDWRLIIKLEDIVDDYYFGYPTLLDGAETAPPEDVGGLHGFYEFLKVYYDETHPYHDEIKGWAKEQGFEEYDPERINYIIKDRKYKKTEWDKIKHERYKIIEDKYRKK